MITYNANTGPNKTDAGNGSKAICRVYEVLRSPSPDPRRSPKTESIAMSKSYFRCLYRRKGTERYLIWFTDDRDGVFTDERSQVPTFASAMALELAFPALVDAELVSEEPILHDLDVVEAPCLSDCPLVIDCDGFLAAWNLFIDVARSVGDTGAAYLASDSALGNEYEKLFFGNNLPAMTPPGQHYTPTWTTDELDDIRRHMLLGIEMFDAVTYAHH